MGRPKRRGKEPSKWAPNEDGTVDSAPQMDDATGVGAIGSGRLQDPHAVSNFSPDQGWSVHESGGDNAEASKPGLDIPPSASTEETAEPEETSNSQGVQTHEHGQGSRKKRVTQPHPNGVWVSSHSVIPLASGFYARREGDSWVLVKATGLARPPLLGRTLAWQKWDAYMRGHWRIRLSLRLFLICMLVVVFSLIWSEGSSPTQPAWVILGAALVMGFSGVVLSSTTIGSREIETLPQGDLDAGLAFSARKAVVVGWMLRTCLVLSAAAMMVVAVFQLLGSGPPAMIMMVLLAGLIIPLFGPVVARLGLVRTFMSRFAQDPDAGGQQTGKARSSNLIPTRIRPAWSGFVIPGQALSSRITAKAEEWDRAPSVDLVLEAGNGNRRSRTITCIEVMSLWIVLVWGLLNRADMLEDVYIPGHALAALLIAFPMWVLAVFRGPFGYIATYRQRTRGAFIKKVPPRTNGQDKLALLGSWFVILLTAATISATLWDQHLWRFDNLFMITTAVTCCIASVPWAIAKIVNHYHRWSFLKDSRYISPYA